METADIIIIGGGVLGAAVAWNLARRKAGRILVLERGASGQGNSSMAAGLLTTARFKPDLIKMVRETYAAIEAIEASTGDTLEAHRSGCLYAAASAGQQDRLRQMAGLAQEAGLIAEWIEPADANGLAPWLALPEGSAALWMPGDAFIDGYTLARGYMQAARAMGAELREQTAVRAIRRDGGRVVGVTTDGGEIEAGLTIDAAGVWAGLLALAIGVAMPMAPVRSQYWITASHPDFTPDQPFVILPDARAYARPESNGLLFGLREPVSVSVDPRELPESMSGYVIDHDSNGWASLEEGIPALAEYFPLAQTVEIKRYISGLSNYTPDGMYVLGKVPGLDGFHAATGCSGAGIAMSGGIGRAVAELATGIEPFVDLTPHRIERFGAVDPLDAEFRRRCGEARAGKITG